MELDRRATERDRLREERREEERRKLEDARRQVEPAQEKGSAPDLYARNAVGGAAGPAGSNSSYYLSRAEEKEAAAAAASRRQDKLARDEMDRAEALRAARAAEEENRRQRAVANSKLYSDGVGPSGVGGSVFQQPVSSVNRYNSGKAEHEARAKASHGMPADELAQKLTDATQGRNNRYADPSAGSGGAPGRRQTDPHAARSGYSSGTASDEDGDDGEVLWSEETPTAQLAEEEEDMRRREDELREELNMATLRCEELKRTLLETKSFIDPRDRVGGGSIVAAAMMPDAGKRRPPAVSTIASAEDDEDDDEMDEEEDEDVIDEGDEGDDDDQLDTPVKLPSGSGREESKYGGGGGRLDGEVLTRNHWWMKGERGSTHTQKSSRSA